MSFSCVIVKAWSQQNIGCQTKSLLPPVLTHEDQFPTTILLPNKWKLKTQDTSKQKQNKEKNNQNNKKMFYNILYQYYSERENMIFQDRFIRTRTYYTLNKTIQGLRFYKLLISMIAQSLKMTFKDVNKHLLKYSVVQLLKLHKQVISIISQPINDFFYKIQIIKIMGQFFRPKEHISDIFDSIDNHVEYITRGIMKDILPLKSVGLRCKAPLTYSQICTVYQGDPYANERFVTDYPSIRRGRISWKIKIYIRRYKNIVSRPSPLGELSFSKKYDTRYVQKELLLLAQQVIDRQYRTVEHYEIFLEEFDWKVFQTPPRNTSMFKMSSKFRAQRLDYIYYIPRNRSRNIPVIIVHYISQWTEEQLSTASPIASIRDIFKYQFTAIELREVPVESLNNLSEEKQIIIGCPEPLYLL